MLFRSFIYPSGEAPAAQPKLQYAAIFSWAPAAKVAPRPTGRLAYLGKVLPKLR